MNAKQAGEFEGMVGGKPLVVIAEEDEALRITLDAVVACGNYRSFTPSTAADGAAVLRDLASYERQAKAHGFAAWTGRVVLLGGPQGPSFLTHPAVGSKPNPRFETILNQDPLVRPAVEAHHLYAGAIALTRYGRAALGPGNFGVVIATDNAKDQEPTRYVTLRELGRQPRAVQFAQRPFDIDDILAKLEQANLAGHEPVANGVIHARALLRQT